MFYNIKKLGWVNQANGTVDSLFAFAEITFENFNFEILRKITPARKTLSVYNAKHSS